ncbi:MAG TPA: RNA methyltransferase [Chryseosolibacter sp.]
MTDKEILLTNHLSQFVSDHKKEFVDRVLNERTRYVTIVLENIYQSQNASATLRTSECMGLQGVHIVENTAKYQLNIRVLKGADKWLELHRYRTRGINNTEVCFSRLKSEGYKIYVADPAEGGVPVDELRIDNKIALVFGNELRGVSDYAIENADGKMRIPMYGFTESLNISVSVAISLNTIMKKLRASDVDFRLTEEEKRLIRLEWFKKIVKRSDLLEREFLRTIQ